MVKSGCPHANLHVILPSPNRQRTTTICLEYEAETQEVHLRVLLTSGLSVGPTISLYVWSRKLSRLKPQGPPKENSKQPKAEKTPNSDERRTRIKNNFNIPITPTQPSRQPNLITQRLSIAMAPLPHVRVLLVFRHTGFGHNRR